MTELQQFFASSITGTEKALCDELRDLGFSSVRLNRGGIPFRGTWQDGWRACLESRIALRIQVLMHRFEAPSPEALYAGIQAVDWTPFITHEQTLAVDAVCRSSTIRHSGFAALKTKDAIVDQLRDAQGNRPTIDTQDPDVRVFLYLVADKASIYLDLSGASLHRRGYRTEAGEAPLREPLAAAILRMAEWDRKTPLIDPMCGSGTIPIEAAMWASNKAPGLSRDRFGFERWANFSEDDRAALSELRGALRGAHTGQQPKIQAADIDEDMLTIAKSNARRAGVRLALKHRPVQELQPSNQDAFVIFNPPYGKRLEADTALVHEITAAVTRWHGWRAALLTASPEYEKQIALKPTHNFRIKNGDLDCRLLVYDVP